MPDAGEKLDYIRRLNMAYDVVCCLLLFRALFFLFPPGEFSESKPSFFLNI